MAFYFTNFSETTTTSPCNGIKTCFIKNIKKNKLVVDFITCEFLICHYNFPNLPNANKIFEIKKKELLIQWTWAFSWEQKPNITSSCPFLINTGIRKQKVLHISLNPKGSSDVPTSVFIIEVRITQWHQKPSDLCDFFIMLTSKNNTIN